MGKIEPEKLPSELSFAQPRGDCVCTEKRRQEVARDGNKQPPENALEEHLIDHPRGIGPHLLTMLLGLVSGHRVQVSAAEPGLGLFQKRLIIVFHLYLAQERTFPPTRLGPGNHY